MSKNNIKTSGFSLAKRKELTGDDFYEIKQFDDMTVAVVCDGVGSAQEGAMAAKKVTQHIINNFKNIPKVWSIEKAMKEFITSINSILYAQSIHEYERPEYVTTLTVCVIKGNRLYGANAGDSRIYLLRDNKLTQLSYDHNEEGMAGVLSNAVGICESVEIFYFENNIQKDDKILMCSDGLYSLMSNDTLLKNIPNGAYQIVKKASFFVEDNLPDDTTAVILEILEADPIELMKNLNLGIPEKLKKGDIIDGYELTLSLIQNNRTWVCKKNNQEYVIKFAPYEAIENEEILDLYIKEAWNAKRLKAGFFPKTFIPKQRSARYYLMTKLDGINLKQYLKKRNLSIDEAINLAKTLISMSEYLLKFNLVHGDIKPENIIVIQRDGKKIFKIIDFGSITEIFSITNKAGTPSYLAPERFKGSAINEKTEIFSIGVTLYQALTGKFPYGEIEPFQNPTFGTAKKPQKLNSNIPFWLDSLILRAISTKEDLRYSNYSYMKFELEYPNKVKPFLSENTPLFERNPEQTYRIGFIISFIINCVLLVYVLK
ncbi:MAG: bifunctional protein-serine/threonine kinase/phosphatase [Aliarcobacter sp.]|nr:bifunctional protein-serine/threonine kinase/phosphatase [Aliarcobacter sp.]